MAKTRIQRLREPSLKLVDSVTLEMTTIAREVVSKVARPSSPVLVPGFGWSLSLLALSQNHLMHPPYF